MNINRVSAEPVYVLHRRPFRETSFLIELFSLAHGRLTAIAKGVRKARSANCALLQPFVPLLVSWQGRSDLMTITAVELKSEMAPLPSNCLFAGFYLNELLMALLERWDGHPKLFLVYEKTLNIFKQGQFSEAALRSFEKQLLEEIGYGFLPKLINEQAFLVDKYYNFVPEHGFTLTESGALLEGQTTFSGQNLMAIAKEHWTDETVLKDAKRLIRLVLKPLLGNKEIHSKKLFIKYDENIVN